MKSAESIEGKTIFWKTQVRLTAQEGATNNGIKKQESKIKSFLTLRVK